MKFLFPVALLACAVLGNAAAAEGLPPSHSLAAQKEGAIWAARLVDRYRYKTEGLPDGIGARPFNRFIEALDAERMLFTQADLAAMADQGAQLDKLTDEKQLEIPGAIFATYVARATELHAHAQEILRQPLDFSGHERLQRVRSKAAWEPDDTALRKLWRRRVMDDYLSLRLAGGGQTQIVPTLQQRYDRYLQRIQSMRADEVISLYLNAYVAYFDPHGAYFGPVPSTTERLPGDMVGIGLVLQKKDELITVLEVAAGSPAHHSGDIGPGDRIVGVAQGLGQQMTDVIGWRVDEVVKLLRGVPGSPVVLDILPQGAAHGSTTRRIPLSRAKITIDEARAKGRIELIQRGASTYRIGVIAVPTFYQDFAARKAGAKDYMSVTRDVAAALAAFKAQEVDAVLLDMRNNGGGSLIEAIDLTGLFLPGVPVAQQITYDRKLTVEKAPQGAPAWDGTLAVLIDRRSAAATEITAAAIQDYGRGLIIGDTSYGRGSVQSLVDLSRFSKGPATPMGNLKLTIAVLCRAGGGLLQRAGVTPDLVAKGRIDVTGKANADLFAGAACKMQDIPKNPDLGQLVPTLAKLQATRMETDQRYQSRIAQRAQDEARLASDEVSLNEAERRRELHAPPAGDIAQLQLAEALQVVSDTVELIRKRSGRLAGKP